MGINKLDSGMINFEEMTEEQVSYYQRTLKNYSTIAKETDNKIEKDLWYNCGGFAVGTFHWLAIDEFMDAEDELIDVVTNYREYEDDINEEDFLRIKEDLQFQIEDTAQRCVDELLENYDYIRLIKSYEELEEKEYAFVFRTAADDFHFMRRFSNGQWAHKRGSFEVEEVEEEDVFAEEWSHGSTPYNSKIYMFACANQ